MGKIKIRYTYNELLYSDINSLYERIESNGQIPKKDISIYRDNLKRAIKVAKSGEFNFGICITKSGISQVGYKKLPLK
ncbi:MAG: hypothetical protein KAS32_18635 [Candidatus Peribacteraceae bacterium]|nr:hypothetical protein [Candidatus Peribacteraceae bacterium]